MVHERNQSIAGLVAGAYDLSQDLAGWFGQGVASFRRQMDEGLGAWGAIVDVDHAALRHWQSDGAHPADELLMRTGLAAGFLRYVPPGCAAVSPVGMIGVSSATWPHFAAALRLRRSLTGLSLDTASAEAIFEPSGRCLNARGMAEAASVREILRSEVVKRECSCGRLEDASDAPRDALLEGRWSLVDRLDIHGQRYIVAYRNPAGVLDPRRLTAREREVTARIATGMNHKAIASELGISPSTVASVAAQVISKLGLLSTRQIPLFWRDAGGRAVPLGRGELMAIQGDDGCFAPAERLTPAERAVLDGVIVGQSDREIAKERGTSVRTVAKQVAALLRKFHATGRGELSALGLELADLPRRGHGHG